MINRTKQSGAAENRSDQEKKWNKGIGDTKRGKQKPRCTVRHSEVG